MSTQAEAVQEPIVAFLKNPNSYGLGVTAVEVVETHISRIFLAGDRAYKLKRAVSLAYVDFASPEARRDTCEAELQLNRQTAPDLYLKVRGITIHEDGSIAWADQGQPASDWVVVMRRFDQRQLLDSIAQRGGLDAQLVIALVKHVAEFHAHAEPRPRFGGAAALAAIVEENNDCLVAAGSELFPAECVGELHERSRAYLTSISDVLDRRRCAGKVRRCHGDLHLGNICLLNGKPVLFDCLEFSEPLASTDVLYDFAFLVMDFERRNLAGLANLALNRYLDLTGEDDGLCAMPLFLSLRAAIRAHVTAAPTVRWAATGGQPEARETARAYLNLALRSLSPRRARLIAIGGLSGTGKSTVAHGLAPQLSTLPGARVLRSDSIRKRLWGVQPETHLPATAYEPEFTERVYQTIRQKAQLALEAGYSVVIDAVSLKEAERRSFSELAATAGVPFSGIWLTADPAILVDRIRQRRQDASDASVEVLEQQLGIDPGSIEWTRVAAGADREAVLAAATRAIGSATGEPAIAAL